jgi:hypothetical protein
MGFISEAAGVALGFLILSGLVLIAMLLVQQKRKRLPMRSLPAFQDIREEIGCAAEQGKPIHIALGSGGVNDEDSITSLAGFQVVEGIVDAAVSYQISPIITVGNPTLLPLAQDILRRAHERHQMMDLYDPGCVRFVAPSPIAYAGGTAYTVASEDLTASVMMGSFQAEASLIADAGARSDLPHLAGAADPAAVGALYPTVDRLAVGEELYAAGAQLTGKRSQLAGLVAQDILRLVIVLAILGTAVAAFWPNLQGFLGG